LSARGFPTEEKGYSLTSYTEVRNGQLHLLEFLGENFGGCSLQSSLHRGKQLEDQKGERSGTSKISVWTLEGKGRLEAFFPRVRVFNLRRNVRQLGAGRGFHSTPWDQLLAEELDEGVKGTF